MDSLRDALWESEAPPGSEMARERTVQAIREREAAQPGSANPHWVARVAAVAAACVALMVATPPGRDAISWAADLVGIGEVGGPPVTPTSNRAPDPSIPPIVFATGTASTGEAYELYAYRSEDLAGMDAGTCVATRMIESEQGGGTLCYSRGPTEQGIRIGEFSTSDDFDLGFLGGEVSLAADRVVIEYTVPGEVRQSLDATVADLDGELAERIEIPNPTSFFVAFLEGATDIRDICDYEIRATAFDAAGEELARDEPASCSASAQAAAQEHEGRVLEMLRSACEGEEIERRSADLTESCRAALEALRADR